MFIFRKKKINKKIDLIDIFYLIKDSFWFLFNKFKNMLKNSKGYVNFNFKKNLWE